MTATSASRWLIFTDLDGSLLDHDTYSHAPADPTLERCEAQAIPVICCTSKTRAELLSLREELENQHPFIVENGAAVFIPEGYFPTQPDDTELKDGYWVKAFCHSRQHWLTLLQQVPDALRQPLYNFSRMGDAGVAEATGLPLHQARLANQRDYSEPALWQGSDSARQQFVDWFAAHGGRIQQGGRFLHITDQCDKGQALQWLATIYRQHSPDHPITTLAAGDSHNDVSMLEVADAAVVIRSPVHAPPQLQHNRNALTSTALGPDGWVEGVTAFIPTLIPSGACP